MLRAARDTQARQADVWSTGRAGRSAGDGGCRTCPARGRAWTVPRVVHARRRIVVVSPLDDTRAQGENPCCLGSSRHTLIGFH